MIITGTCHCRNISVRFETRRAEAELNPVTCPCGFCAAHGAVYVADSDGTATLHIEEPGAVVHYRFGEQTTEYLICGRCGIFVAAIIGGNEEEQPACFSALNLNVMDQAAGAPSVDEVWKNQTAEERRIFRQTRWTPTVITQR